jgi:hypothetical protein
MSSLLRVLLLAVLAALAAPRAASACFVVIPTTVAFTGGVAVLALQCGGAVLLAVVLVKCALYARFAGPDGRARAFLAMFGANLYSTVVGIIASVPLAAPVAFLGILPFLFAFCWWSARALSRGLERPRLGPFVWALLLFGCAFASMVFFVWSQSLLQSRPELFLFKYWTVKTCATTAAVACGFVLTCALELSILLRNVKDPCRAREVTAAVLRANLWTFFLAALAGALAILPARLRSPDGLVSGPSLTI